MQGGTSNINFSYKIIARRKGFEDLHFATKEQVQQASNIYIHSEWPEIITSNTERYNSTLQKINSQLPQIQSPTQITQTQYSAPSITKPNATFTNTSNDVPASEPIQAEPAP